MGEPENFNIPPAGYFQTTWQRCSIWQGVSSKRAWSTVLTKRLTWGGGGCRSEQSVSLKLFLCVVRYNCWQFLLSPFCPFQPGKWGVPYIHHGEVFR